MSAERLQRWAVKLSTYDYTVECRRCQDNRADILSRYPLAGEVCAAVSGSVPGWAPEETEAEAFAFRIAELPISAGQVATATRTDPVLARVYTWTLDGWLQTLSGDYSEWERRREELTITNGVLLCGDIG